MKRQKKSSILFLFGPTGVGKTDLLFSLFSKRFEVINADSMQVYKGLDIGSAKPSKEILHTVPHHLIDLLPPSEQFSVADFVRTAHKVIPEIRDRGNIPLVSGGTAFYFKHLLLGLPEAPPSDGHVRSMLERRCDTEGIESLYAELAAVDPVSHGRIHISDRYRIVRALEVYTVSGKPLSSFRETAAATEIMHPLIIGLHRERAELYERINRRVEIMFQEGLVDELRRLMAAGAVSDWPGMRGIGYREFFTAQEAGELSYNGIKKLIQQHSRLYAKRQMTFFRSLPDVNWVHPSDTDTISRLLDTYLDGSQ